MKTFSSVILGLTLLFSASSTRAQGFINLDFESANVESFLPGDFGIDWNLAAPGWNHSTGSSTGVIYYQQEHLGMDQIYLLKDFSSPAQAPDMQLAGEYSLAFASGFSAPSFTQWINAFISQSAMVPGSSQSLWMLATGPFEVLMNGVPINMLSMGGNSYAGDISGFAGGIAELKIRNTAGINAFRQYTTVDNIQFSPTVVPEPASLSVIATGVALAFGRRRLR